MFAAQIAMLEALAQAYEMDRDHGHATVHRRAALILKVKADALTAKVFPPLAGEDALIAALDTGNSDLAREVIALRAEIARYALTDENVERVAMAIYRAYAGEGSRWELVEPQHQENVWRNHALAALTPTTGDTDYCGIVRVPEDDDTGDKDKGI